MKQKTKYTYIIAAAFILSGTLGLRMYAHAEIQAPSIITHNLSVGSRSEEVSWLQEFLKNQGFFTYPQITGYFGPITKAAVAAFQKAYGIMPVGMVGPITRAKIAEIMSQKPVTSIPPAPIVPEDTTQKRTTSHHLIHTHTLSGEVSGLSDSGLVLQNNGADDLSVSADGSFTFARTIRVGTSYDVTVSEQPSGQTCVVANGTGTMSGSNVANVSVSCAATLESITVLPSNSHLPATIEEQFTATAHYSDSSTADITASVAWDTSNHSVATINETGLGTGVAAGITEVYASLDGVTGATNLIVTNAVLISITITPTNPAVARDSTLQLSAIGTFSDASTVDITNQASWSSSLTNIATVNDTDNKGNATGVAGGTSTISAGFHSVTGTATLHVGA